MGTIHMSASEFARMFPNATNPSVPQRKYLNHKVYVYSDGFVSEQTPASNHGKLVCKYDSKKEFLRHRELQLLERAGKISELKTQVKMPVSEAFSDKDGKKHRAVVYCADFTYTENGREVVEDVKGQDARSGKYQMTSAFRIKWKLLQAKYPEKTFRLY